MEKEPLINFIKKNIPNITVTQAGLETIAAHFEELIIVAGGELGIGFEVIRFGMDFEGAAREIRNVKLREASAVIGIE